MKLYHFTCVEHLPKILIDRKLTRTQSNISLEEPEVGPQVVWLTTDRTPYRGHGLYAGGSLALTPEQARLVGRPAGSRVTLADKMAVRFTVELPLAHVRLWRKWAPQHGSSADTMQRLARAGGSDSWFVSEQEIPAESWTAVETIRAVGHRPDVLRAIVQSGVTVGVRPSWKDQTQAEKQAQLARIRALIKTG
jgi:hypothetical protein